MSNSNLKALISRRTQLLDELWELDKELTRLEGEERERVAALGPLRPRRRCAACGRVRDCKLVEGKWRCSRCRGIARSAALDARERPSASQTGAE